jgi:hypothetical protein
MNEILTIPDYQSIMLPLLKLSSDGLEHSSRQTVETVFHLMVHFAGSLWILLPQDQPSWGFQPPQDLDK